MFSDPPPTKAPIVEDKTASPFWAKWFFDVSDRLKSSPFRIAAYAVADLPSATEWGDNDTFSSLVHVTDEIGGAVLAFSDGTNWRRVTDRAVVS